MSFFASISQCGEIGHAEKAFLAWWRSSNEKAGVMPLWAAWWDSEKAIVEKKSARKMSSRDKAFLIEAEGWWKRVLACLPLWALNRSAFKSISREVETQKSSPASSPSFVPKAPIPSPIWMGCCFEFWWRENENPPLPDFAPLQHFISPPRLHQSSHAVQTITFSYCLGWSSGVFSE